jgi:hypothetical protein
VRRRALLVLWCLRGRVEASLPARAQVCGASREQVLRSPYEIKVGADAGAGDMAAKISSLVCLPPSSAFAGGLLLERSQLKYAPHTRTTGVGGRG